MLPNRIAVYFTAAAALAAALVPVIANLDITSTVGIVGGVAALAGVVSVWLNGWQKYEERTALEPLIEEQLNVKPPNVGDPGTSGTTLKRPS